MPRNRGIGATRKKKKPTVADQEVVEDMDIPEEDGDDAKPTYSSINDGLDQSDVNSHTLKEAGLAMYRMFPSLQKLLDGVDMTAFCQARVNYLDAKQKLAVTTRARGAATTNEANLKADNEWLEVQLQVTEQMLETSDAMVEAAEFVFKKYEAEIESMKDLISINDNIRACERKMLAGTEFAWWESTSEAGSSGSEPVDEVVTAQYAY